MSSSNDSKFNIKSSSVRRIVFDSEDEEEFLLDKFRYAPQRQQTSRRVDKDLMQKFKLPEKSSTTPPRVEAVPEFIVVKKPKRQGASEKRLRQIETSIFINSDGNNVVLEDNNVADNFEIQTDTKESIKNAEQKSKPAKKLRKSKQTHHEKSNETRLFLEPEVSSTTTQQQHPRSSFDWNKILKMSVALVLFLAIFGVVYYEMSVPTNSKMPSLSRQHRQLSTRKRGCPDEPSSVFAPTPAKKPKQDFWRDERVQEVLKAYWKDNNTPANKSNRKLKSSVIFKDLKKKLHDMTTEVYGKPFPIIPDHMIQELDKTVVDLQKSIFWDSGPVQDILKAYWNNNDTPENKDKRLSASSTIYKALQQQLGGLTAQIFGETFGIESKLLTLALEKLVGEVQTRLYTFYDWNSANNEFNAYIFWRKIFLFVIGKNEQVLSWGKLQLFKELIDLGVVTGDETSYNAFRSELQNREASGTVRNLNKFEEKMITDFITYLNTRDGAKPSLSYLNIKSLNKIGVGLFERHGIPEFLIPAIIQPFRLMVHQFRSEKQIDALNAVRLYEDPERLTDYEVKCTTFLNLKTVFRSSHYTPSNEPQNPAISREVIDCFLKLIETNYNNNNEDKKITIPSLSTFKEEIVGNQQRITSIDTNSIVIFFNGNEIKNEERSKQMYKIGYGAFLFDFNSNQVMVFSPHLSTITQQHLTTMIEKVIEWLKTKKTLDDNQFTDMVIVPIAQSPVTHKEHKEDQTSNPAIVEEEEECLLLALAALDLYLRGENEAFHYNSLVQFRESVVLSLLEEKKKEESIADFEETLAFETVKLERSSLLPPTDKNDKYFSTDSNSPHFLQTVLIAHFFNNRINVNEVMNAISRAGNKNAIQQFEVTNYGRPVCKYLAKECDVGCIKIADAYFDRKPNEVDKQFVEQHQVSEGGDIFMPNIDDVKNTVMSSVSIAIEDRNPSQRSITEDMECSGDTVKNLANNPQQSDIEVSIGLNQPSTNSPLSAHEAIALPRNEVGQQQFNVEDFEIPNVKKVFVFYINLLAVLQETDGIIEDWFLELLAYKMTAILNQNTAKSYNPKDVKNHLFLYVINACTNERRIKKLAEILTALRKNNGKNQQDIVDELKQIEGLGKLTLTEFESTIQELGAKYWFMTGEHNKRDGDVNSFGESRFTEDYFESEPILPGDIYEGKLTDRENQILTNFYTHLKEAENLVEEMQNAEIFKIWKCNSFEEARNKREEKGDDRISEEEVERMRKACFDAITNYEQKLAATRRHYNFDQNTYRLDDVLSLVPIRQISDLVLQFNIDLLVAKINEDANKKNAACRMRIADAAKHIYKMDTSSEKYVRDPLDDISELDLIKEMMDGCAEKNAYMVIPIKVQVSVWDPYFVLLQVKIKDNGYEIPADFDVELVDPHKEGLHEDHEERIFTNLKKTFNEALSHVFHKEGKYTTKVTNLGVEYGTTDNGAFIYCMASQFLRGELNPHECMWYRMYWTRKIMSMNLFASNGAESKYLDFNDPIEKHVCDNFVRNNGGERKFEPDVCPTQTCSPISPRYSCNDESVCPPATSIRCNSPKQLITEALMIDELTGMEVEPGYTTDEDVDDDAMDDGSEDEVTTQAPAQSQPTHTTTATVVEDEDEQMEEPPEDLFLKVNSLVDGKCQPLPDNEIDRNDELTGHFGNERSLLHRGETPSEKCEHGGISEADWKFGTITENPEVDAPTAKGTEKKKKPTKVGWPQLPETDKSNFYTKITNLFYRCFLHGRVMAKEDEDLKSLVNKIEKQYGITESNSNTGSLEEWTKIFQGIQFLGEKGTSTATEEQLVEVTTTLRNPTTPPRKRIALLVLHLLYNIKKAKGTFRFVKGFHLNSRFMFTTNGRARIYPILHIFSSRLAGLSTSHLDTKYVEIISKDVFDAAKIVCVAVSGIKIPELSIRTDQDFYVGGPIKAQNDYLNLQHNEDDITADSSWMARERTLINIGQNVKGVLYIEKVGTASSIIQQLLELFKENQLDKELIIIGQTGNTPYYATKIFVNKMVYERNLHLFTLVDADPAGLSMSMDFISGTQNHHDNIRFEASLAKQLLPHTYTLVGVSVHETKCYGISPERQTSENKDKSKIEFIKNMAERVINNMNVQIVSQPTTAMSKSLEPHPFYNSPTDLRQELTSYVEVFRKNMYYCSINKAIQNIKFRKCLVLKIRDIFGKPQDQRQHVFTNEQLKRICKLEGC